ncbi:roadblock/LC7 domain-containing protein [Nocardia asteroides]|uniref:roadblock/LC7 domain-containing protein n=1 Tax=Nocardia asteroides TaxID=1824 RepID=UPI001E5E8315|nr:roadblock/LC7 domain-containing protein [Nocardia asteroides]UGT55168.1 roadblock/LC7 domain-containing protein [Nocardia asteroides]
MNVTVGSPIGELDWLLDELIARLAGAEHAVVLSDDGLVIARSGGVLREDAEHLAAMASAFGSLARGVGSQFRKGAMQQTVVELEYGYLVVTDAGQGASLALLASEDADLGMVAYEMNVIVQQVGDKLSASPRTLPGASNAT